MVWRIWSIGNLGLVVLGNSEIIEQAKLKRLNNQLYQEQRPEYFGPLFLIIMVNLEI